MQFEPTYYEQSDGYREYLTEINKITDPAARQEMIRGGQEAYKYIIASSNEDIFKDTVAQKQSHPRQASSSGISARN